MNRYMCWLTRTWSLNSLLIWNINDTRNVIDRSFFSFLLLLLLLYKLQVLHHECLPLNDLKIKIKKVLPPHWHVAIGFTVSFHTTCMSIYWMGFGGVFAGLTKKARMRCWNAEVGLSRSYYGTVNRPIIALVFLWVGDSSVVASHQP